MTICDDDSVDVFGDDFGDLAFRIKDIVFGIMLSGVTSIPGITMELNRQGCWGKEWRAVDVRRLLAED